MEGRAVPRPSIVGHSGGASVTRRERTLRMYGEAGAHAGLGWSWVQAELAGAGTYWLVLPTGAPPHPRPVWGIWLDDRLQLSVGSPVLRRAGAVGDAVTVHLDSGTDVVIVEGVLG